MKKSAIIPLSILFLMVGGIFLLGRIGGNIDERIVNEGVDGVCTAFDEGKRMIKIKYLVDGIEYKTGVGKGHSGVIDGEQFMIQYLPKDPESVVVFWDKPYLSDKYSYTDVECVSITKELSIIYYEYEVDGERIKRSVLYRNQSLDPSKYIIRYRDGNPNIGYLIRK
jgi:hypothetical protein